MKNMSLNYNSNIQTVILRTRAAGEFLTIPFECNVLTVRSATGTITIQVPGDLTRVQADIDRVFRFDRPFSQNTLSIASTSANDTITLDIGFGLIIPQINAASLGTLITSGQFPEGTLLGAIPDATLLPFVGGFARQSNGQIRRFQSATGSGLLVEELLDDGGTNLIPGANTQHTLEASKEMITFRATFANPGDLLTVQTFVQGVATPSPLPIFDAVTFLPVAQPIIADGTYFIHSEGLNAVTFSANAGNTGDILVASSASRACRPALTPVALRNAAGTPFANQNALPVSGDFQNVPNILTNVTGPVVSSAVATNGKGIFSIHAMGIGGSVTACSVRLEFSNDGGATWCLYQANPNYSLSAFDNTLGTFANLNQQMYGGNRVPATHIRFRVNSITLGTGSGANFHLSLKDN